MVVVAVVVDVERERREGVAAVIFARTRLRSRSHLDEVMEREASHSGSVS